MMARKSSSLTNAFLSLLIVVLVLAYPFMVYQYVEEVSPRWFAGVLFMVFLVRFFVAGATKKTNDWLILGAVSAFCLSVTILESEQLLKLYPVMMNIGVGLMFIASLTSEQCLTEKLANLSGKTPPPEAHSYLRTLTLLWGMLLIANGAVSAYTAWYTDLSVWALYNGFVSYLLLACFAVGEWVYRGYYKKKHNIIDA